MAPGIKDEEIKCCFEKFDSDGDENISFREFEKILTCGLNTN